MITPTLRLTRARPHRSKAFVIALHDRILSIMEWYAGCALCPETIANIDRDLASVLSEEVERFHIHPPAWKLKAWAGSDGIVTVRAVANGAN